MFDAHAHIGIISDNAFVCSASPEEKMSLLPYKYKAVGLLPGFEGNEEELFEAAREGFHIGEIGLDARFPDEERQETIFRAALEAARDYDRIAVVHIVRRYQKAYEIIKESGIKRFLVHGYTGSREMAEAFIKCGGIISISPRAEKAKSFASLLSLPFATETDMPTGPDEEHVLSSWNMKLSEITGLDIAERTARMLMEVLS